MNYSNNFQNNNQSGQGNAYGTPNDYSYNVVPPQYKPLGAWAYFGYSLLFSIPLLGFILLIVFSFSDSNINRRNFARSYWCIYLIAFIIGVVSFATGIVNVNWLNILKALSRS